MALIKVGSGSKGSGSSSPHSNDSTNKSVSIKKPSTPRMTRSGGCTKCGR